MVDPREVLRTLYENIRTYREQVANDIEQRARREAGEAHLPPPPTMSSEWRERARDVFVRLHSELRFERAPWHHEEMWAWAGSTLDGQDWFRREVIYWEERVEWHATRKRLEHIRLCEEGFGLSDGTTMRTLLKRGRKDGRPLGAADVDREMLMFHPIRAVHSDYPEEDLAYAKELLLHERNGARQRLKMLAAWSGDNDAEGDGR